MKPATELADAVRRAVARLKPGTTCCPGELARQLGTTQATLRPVLRRLADAGHVRITQRGQKRDLATLRGPYRVGAAEGGGSSGWRGPPA